MKRIFALYVLFSTAIWADSARVAVPDSAAGHVHQDRIERTMLAVDQTRFAAFIDNLGDSRIAVVRVQGMVCDFCARGIEKNFKQDSNVRKIDVDLSRGKVLIAYTAGSAIHFPDIQQKILENGQNATGLRIVEIYEGELYEP